MYLLAGCCAREFGWIDTARAGRPAGAPRSTPSTAWPSTRATSTTGTTRGRSQCCRRPTCPASTAATSPATCWPWRRPAGSFARRRHRRSGRARSSTRSPQRCEALCAGDGLPRPLRRQAPPVPHRPAGRGATRSTPATTTCWRPSRACSASWPSPRATCRGATGRRSGRPFLSVGVAPGPEVLVGLDVRVPDALAGDGRAGRRPAAGGRACAAVARAAGLRQRAATCPGASPNRPTSRRTIRWPTSTRPSACRGWRCAARRRPTAWSRPMPALMAAHARAGTTRCATCGCSNRWARAASSASSTRSTSPCRASPRARPQRGAQLHGAPPGHVAGGAVQRCCATTRRAAGSARAPLVQAHESLLHERTPRQIIGSADPRTPPEPARQAKRRRCSSRARSIRWRRLAAHAPAVQRPLHAWRCAPTAPASSRWRCVQRQPLARRSAARRLRHLLLRARQRQATRSTSLTALPAPGDGWRYRARFLADQVQFDAQRRRTCRRAPPCWSAPRTTPSCARSTLHNTGSETRTLELISYFEPVLSQPQGRRGASGLRQPVRRKPLGADAGARCCWRASRGCTATPVMAAAHFVAAVDAQRAAGRLHGRPARLHRPQPHARRRRARCRSRWTADGTPVNGLDPIACLRVRLSIAPGATARVTFATAAADNTEALMPLHRPLPAAHARASARRAWPPRWRRCGCATSSIDPAQNARAAGPDDHPDLHHAARRCATAA